MKNRPGTLTSLMSSELMMDSQAVIKLDMSRLEPGSEVQNTRGPLYFTNTFFTSWGSTNIEHEIWLRKARLLTTNYEIKLITATLIVTNIIKCLYSQQYINKNFYITRLTYNYQHCLDCFSLKWVVNMPIAKIDLPKHVQPASISHNVVAKNDRHFL